MGSLIDAYIDGANVTGFINGSQITGTLDASIVTGTLTEATIDASRVTTLSGFLSAGEASVMASQRCADQTINVYSDNSCLVTIATFSTSSTNPIENLYAFINCKTLVYGHLNSGYTSTATASLNTDLSIDNGGGNCIQIGISGYPANEAVDACQYFIFYSNCAGQGKTKKLLESFILITNSR